MIPLGGGCERWRKSGNLTCETPRNQFWYLQFTILTPTKYFNTLTSLCHIRFYGSLIPN